MMSGTSEGTRESAAANALPLIVLVDANVFFGPRLRDLFMYLHAQEVIHIAWTTEIESEWVRNVTQKHQADAMKIRDCLHGMREAIPDWQVDDYKEYEEKFALVDSKDRHVAAAAYKLALSTGGSIALVTNNIQDFPATAFSGTEVSCYSVSDYLAQLYAAFSEEVLQVLEFSRTKLRAPPLDRTQYVAVLVKNGCYELAAAAALRWDVPCPVLTSAGKVTYDKTSCPTRTPSPIFHPTADS